MENLIPPLGYRNRYHAQVMVVRKQCDHNRPDDESVTSPTASSGLVISFIAIRSHRRLDLVMANLIYHSTTHCAPQTCAQKMRSQHTTHRCGCGDRPHFTLEDKRFEMRTITLLSFGWRWLHLPQTSRTTTCSKRIDLIHTAN